MNLKYFKIPAFIVTTVLLVLAAPTNAFSVVCPVSQLASPPGFCDIDPWFLSVNNSAAAIKNPRKAGGAPDELWILSGTNVYVWAEFIFDRVEPGGSGALAGLKSSGKLEKSDDSSPDFFDDLITTKAGPVIPAAGAGGIFSRQAGLLGEFNFRPTLVPDRFGDPDIKDAVTGNFIENDEKNCSCCGIEAG